MGRAQFVLTSLVTAVTAVLYAFPAAAQTTALFVDRPSLETPGTREQTTLTPSDGTFTITRNDQGGVSVTFAGTETSWSLDFAAGDGIPLATGDYLHALRYGTTAFVGLSLAEGATSCAALTGRFLVLEVEYNGDGSVVRFAADAEQHCDGDADKTYVAVRYVSTLATLNPFNGEYPVYRLTIVPSANGVVTGSAGDNISCGGSLPDCVLTASSPRSVSLTATPNFGHMFTGWSGGCRGGESTTVGVDTVKVCEARFESKMAAAPRTLAILTGEAGHYISGGQKRVFSPANSRWAVDAFNGASSIDISITAPEGSSETTWFLQLIAPSGTTLRPGTYMVPGGFAFDVPRMFFSGGGRACAATGRFVINELTLDPQTGAITALAVDFEHHCDSLATPRMVGSLDYQSTLAIVINPSRHDIDADGRLDLFWQHEADGWIAAWTLRGTQLLEARRLTPDRVDPSWRIVGSADFNGDNRPDLFWQNRTTGAMTVWYMNETSYLGPGLLSNNTVSDLNWRIRAIADFDGDDDPDLLWQHELSGRLAVWIMDGVQLVESRFPTPSEVTDTNWKVAGAADFNADGHTDLFWRHQATGRMVVWYMNGTSFAGAAAVSPDTVADLAWEIRAIADINDDGAPDLLWQRRSDARLSAWLMSGVTLIRGAAFDPVQVTDPSWRIVGPR